MKYFLPFLLPLTMVLALPAVAQLAQPVVDALGRSQLGANAELLTTPEDRQTISDFANTHLCPPWMELKSLPPNQQLILLQTGIEHKSGQDYLDLAISIFQGVAKGELPKQHALLVLSPAAADKEGFLAVNFRDEKLAEALRQLVPLFNDAPDRVAFIEKVLSGKARDEYLKWSSLQGVQPIQPVADASATNQKQAPSMSSNGPIHQSTTHKSTDAKPTPASGNESTALTPGSSSFVFIVVTIGILWLLLKRHS